MTTKILERQIFFNDVYISELSKVFPAFRNNSGFSIQILDSICYEAANNPDCEVIGYTHNNPLPVEQHYTEWIKQLLGAKSALDKVLQTSNVKIIEFAYLNARSEWIIHTIWSRSIEPMVHGTKTLESTL